MRALAGRRESAGGRATSWGHFFILATVIIWGANFVVVKAALDSFSPLVFNAIRFTIAAVLETALVFLRGENLSVSRDDLRRLLPAALWGVISYQVLFIFGIDRTTAGNSSVLLATIPIFVGLGGLLKKERVGRRMWVGAVLTFAGIAMVTLGSGKALAAGRETLLGDLMILLSAACWAAYTVASKAVMQKHSPLKLTALSMVLTAPVLNLLAVPDLIAMDWGGVTTLSWGQLLFSAVFSIALAYLFWNIGVQRLGDARAAIYSNLTPVVSLTIAWIALNERLTILQILGTLVVLSGIGLARRDRRRASPAEVGP